MPAGLEETGLYNWAVIVGRQRKRGRIRSCWGSKFYSVCSDAGVWGVKASVIPTTKFVDLMIWTVCDDAHHQNKECGGSKSDRKTSSYQTHLAVHTLPFLGDKNNLFSLTWLLLFWLRPAERTPGYLDGSWFSHLVSMKQVKCLTPTQQMIYWAETGKQPPWLFRASAFQIYSCVPSTWIGEAHSSTCLLLLGRGESTKTLCVTEIFD